MAVVADPLLWSAAMYGKSHLEELHSPEAHDAAEEQRETAEEQRERDYQELDPESRALAEAIAAEFDDPRLAEALARYQSGDFLGAEALAVAAESHSRQLAALKVADVVEVSGGALFVENEIDDDWKSSLDMLAMAYEDAAKGEQAEALYLRMLAWKEGVEQYRIGHFTVAASLFNKSPEYKTVEDATWFLRGLRPDNAYAIPEVVGLLALGEQVAAKAAVAIWTLALKPKHRPRITECGGLELIAKAVNYHAENAELQAAGCGALRLLCLGHNLASRNQRALIERLDGAAALVNTIRLHAQDPEILREACGALHAAASSNPAGARSIVDCDGMMMCLQAIVGCPNDEAVGDAACKALAALQCASQAPPGTSDAALEDFEAVWENKLHSEREKCLTHCEQEIRRYLECDDRAVLQALLQAVAVFLDDTSVRHGARAVVEPVVACMQRHPGQPRVHKAACDIIWLLSAGHLARESAVAQVAMSGGIAAVCQSMKDLPTQQDLTRTAMGCLRNLCFANDANKTLGCRAGGIAVAVKALQRYPKDTQIQEHGIGVLTSLCDTLGRAVVCAKTGGIEAIIAALKRHAAVGHVAELGCMLLCMFCDEPQLRKQIIQSGAMSIAKALSRNGSSEAQKWGCELLRDLSDA